MTPAATLTPPALATVLRQHAAQRSLFLLGFGANLGNRLDYLNQGLEGLHQRGVALAALSPVVCSPPMGPVEQPDFFNACAWAITPQPPPWLLEQCLMVEQEAGRVREVRWGPRTLDIDLLWWSGGSVREPGLALPHPGLHERDFVLQPALALPLAGELAGLPPGTRALPVVATPAQRHWEACPC